MLSETSMVCGGCPSCSINADGLANVSCTSTNAISFELTPAGTKTSATYNVNISDGAVTNITPSYGTYGATTTFTLNNNSAGCGDVTITITDVEDNTCTRAVVVTDPGTCIIPPEICDNNIDDDGDGVVDCADLDCNCTCTTTITGILSPNVYNDNNTPQDLTDDTYSFQLTVKGNGISWIGGGQTGNYDVLTNFGPYPVDEAASFKIYDGQNRSCFFSVSANMSTCIYLESCTCCK